MDDQENEKETEKKMQHIYPLVRYSDMNDDMRTEVIEMSTTACEKYSGNFEFAARVIKEEMDLKYGHYWHVVIGEGYGFKLNYEMSNILYMFFGGSLAIIIWKCR